ncbi:MAG: hypothetical protein GX288_03555 [Clostridiales bacterium]|nr:hypothetical protein [Clostridiales bacterium]
MSCLLREICRHEGETVTIFTESGGASGCGFTGVLLSVNECFVRLLTREGSAPASPLIGPDCRNDFLPDGRHDYNHHHQFRLGSVCDIPINKIVSFCHNAI